MMNIHRHHDRVRRGSRILLAAAAFCALAGAAWAAGNINISRTPGRFSMGPAIAVDAQGRNHVAWTEVYTFNNNGSATSADVYYVSSDPAGTAWSEPLRLTQLGEVYGRHTELVDIDTDAAGTVYILWIEGRCVRLKVRTPDGVWQPLFTVAAMSGEEANAPVMRVDRLGNIYAMWGSSDFNIYSRARVDGAWEPVRRLNYGGAKYPAISIGTDTVYTTFMSRWSGYGYKTKVCSRPRVLNGEWTAPELIPTSDMEIEDEFQTIEALPDDQAVCAWAAFYMGPQPETGYRIINAATKGVDGTWSPRKEISWDGTLHSLSSCQLGTATFMGWQEGAYWAGTGVWYNVRMNGQWAGPQMLQSSNGSTDVDLDIHPDGTELRFVWDAGGEIIYRSLAVDARAAVVYPPTGVQASASFGTAPDASFTLSWSADPRNGDRVVRYRVFERASGEQRFRVISSEDTPATTFAVPARTTLDDGLVFGVATVSESGQVSEIVTFPLDLRTVKPPADPTLRVSYKSLLTDPKVSWVIMWGNPGYAANFVKTFKVYQRMPGTKDWIPAATAPGSAAYLEVTASTTQRLEFGISALSIFDRESAIVPVSTGMTGTGTTTVTRKTGISLLSRDLRQE